MLDFLFGDNEENQLLWTKILSMHKNTGRLVYVISYGHYFIVKTALILENQANTIIFIAGLLLALNGGISPYLGNVSIGIRIARWLDSLYGYDHN